MSQNHLVRNGGVLFVAVTALIAYRRWRRHAQYRKVTTGGNPTKESLAIGVDFGGTAMKLSLISSHTGEIVGERRVVPIAPSREPGDIVQQIAEAAECLLGDFSSEWSHVKAFGVCCPGRVENGIVSTVANLSGWRDVPLETLIRARTGLEHVYVSNDANAALGGEMWSGAAAHCSNVVMITLGTGVGGAVASQGVILKGSTGMFGEIGHHIICVNGRLSESTGVCGIAEEYCSARALKRTWIALASGSNLDKIPPEPETILQEAQRDSSSLSGRAAEYTFDHIGVLIINACRVYDPECVILGGGLCASEWFVDRCRQAALKLQWKLAPPTFRIVRAIHGNWAGVVGAAALAMKDSK